jgi:hypothetical protein
MHSVNEVEVPFSVRFKAEDFECVPELGVGNERKAKYQAEVLRFHASYSRGERGTAKFLGVSTEDTKKELVVRFKCSSAFGPATTRWQLLRGSQP